MKKKLDDKSILALFLEIFSALRDITEEEVICERFLERIGYHFNIQKAAIFLKDLKFDDMIFVSGIGVNKKSIGISKFSVFHQGIHPIISQNISVKFDFVDSKDVDDFPFLDGTGKAIILPIMSEKRPLGFAFFGRSGINSEIFSDYEENIFSSLLQFLAPIIDLQMTYKELSTSQSKLIEALENLKNFEKIKNSFLYNITHELKTPLVTIVGYSEMLHTKDMGELNQIQMKGVETILKNSSHLLRMIDDLLTFVNLSDKISNLEIKQVNVVEIVKDTIKKFEDSESPIILDSDYKEILIIADQYLISKAIEHLLENAIKFNRNNMPITISLKIDESGNYVLVSVIDNGIGMSFETFKYALENFIQESNDLNRSYGGIGFGLPFVYKIISIHNYEMIFESEKNKGTRIGFKAPVLSFK
ncbi:MAG: hypothetical protein GX435_07645 [Exilispira sp.]|nr:hypothetical protein [Exilispira sp.]